MDLIGSMLFLGFIVQFRSTGDVMFAIAFHISRFFKMLVALIMYGVSLGMAIFQVDGTL